MDLQSIIFRRAAPTISSRKAEGSRRRRPSFCAQADQAFMVVRERKKRYIINYKKIGNVHELRGTLPPPPSQLELFVELTCQRTLSNFMAVAIHTYTISCDKSANHQIFLSQMRYVVCFSPGMNLHSGYT